MRQAGVPDPTPAEIRDRCLEIQEGWTEEDHERRRRGWQPEVSARMKRLSGNHQKRERKDEPVYFSGRIFGCPEPMDE